MFVVSQGLKVPIHYSLDSRGPYCWLTDHTYVGEPVKALARPDLTHKDTSSPGPTGSTLKAFTRLTWGCRH